MDSENKEIEIEQELCRSFSVIDNDTGEIIKTFTKKPSKEEMMGEVYSNVGNKEYLIPWKSHKFVKLYSTEKIPEYETEKYIIYWVKLSKRLSEATNIIAHSTRNGDIPFTREDMCDYLKITERTLRAFIKESKEKNIIVESIIEGDITRTQFVMNPIYTFNGANINYYTFEMFKHDKNFMECLNKTMITHYNYLATKYFDKETHQLIPEV